MYGDVDVLEQRRAHAVVGEAAVLPLQRARRRGRGQRAVARAQPARRAPLPRAHLLPLLAAVTAVAAQRTRLTYK